MASTYTAGSATLDVLPSFKGFHSKLKQELRGINPVLPITADVRQVTRSIAKAASAAPSIELTVKANRASLAKAEADIKAAESRMGAARDTATDSTSRASIAERQLAETRAKNSDDSSKVAAAELKVAQARRVMAAAANDARNAETSLMSKRASFNESKSIFNSTGGAATNVADMLKLGSAATAAGGALQGAGADGAASLGKLAGAAASATGPIGSVVAAGVGVAVIGAAGSTAAAGLIGMANAAISAAGAVALIPGALAAGGLTFATFAIGTMGITDAVEAMGKAHASAGKDAAAGAKSQAAASDAIRTAQTSLSRAREDAARTQVDAEKRVKQAKVDAERAAIASDRQVLAAERSVADAVKARDRAQTDLTAAIAESTAAQKELNFQVRGGALDERQAALDLKVADERLTAAKAAGLQGDELERVSIEYERQKLTVDEVSDSNKQLAAEQKKSEAVGVKGAKNVVDAQERVTQSIQSVADAQDALLIAHEAADYQREQSNRQVQEAEAARTQAATQARRQIADAQAQLASASRQANEAMSSNSAAADALTQALAGLSPEALKFVTAVDALRPAWDGVRKSIQDALFDGLDEKLTMLAGTYLPLVEGGLTKIATAANNAVEKIADMLTEGENVASVKNIMDGTATIVENLGKAMSPIIEAFLTIADVGVEVLADVSDNAVGAGEAFRDWIKDLKDSGKLKDWMTGAVDTITSIIKGVFAFGTAMVSIIQDLNAGVKGSGFFEKVGQVFTDFSNFAKSPEGSTFFYNVGRTIGDVAVLVVKIGELVGQVLKFFSDADTGMRSMTGGATGIFEVISRIALAISTLGLSELIIGIFQLDWTWIGDGWVAGVTEIIGRTILAMITLGLSEGIIALFKLDWKAMGDSWVAGVVEVITRTIAGMLTLGLSEAIIGLFKVDWKGVGDWFTTGTGEVIGRVILGLATLGLSEALIGLFKIDWDKIGKEWGDGLRKAIAKAGEGLANTIVPGPLGTVIGQVFGLVGKADGGYIAGPGTGTSDSIPAMLSNGEYVINAQSTSKHRGLLESLNRNRFADGGLVGPGASVPGTLTAGSAPAPLTIDVSALAALGDVAAAVTASIAALTAQITALVGNVVFQWMAVSAATTSATTGIAAQQLLLEQITTTSWQNMHNSVWGSVTGQNAAFGALQGGMAAVRDAMSATADWAVQQYGRIQGAAADPIRWVLNGPFNAGLIPAWNELDSQFAFGRHINPVPVAFADGGYVSGPGSGTSDSIPARLSNGEFVMPAAITKRALPFLEALRSGQAEALQATGYATGGLVADTGSQLNATIFRAQQWAKEQAGKPYIWGGVGPDGYDCSGFMSAITNILRGESNPHRRLGVAASAPWPGFVEGLSSAFAMGSSAVHTAGTLGGVNVESTGSHVRYGAAASGADSSQFPTRSSLPSVGGQFVPGGGPGIDPKAVMVAAFADTLKKISTVADMWPGNRAAMDAAGVASAATSSLSSFGESKLAAIAATVGGAAGSPEVVAAVRAVAQGFGWGGGAEWDALSALISGESSWDPNIRNPTTSAAGLFQKMQSIHGPLEPTVAGQAQWGLNYIKTHPGYGSPSAAYAAWLSRSPHWYDNGGIASGLGFLQKNTLKPERMLSPAQTTSFDRLVSYIGTSGPESLVQSGNRTAEVTGSINMDGVLVPLINAQIEYFDDQTGSRISHGVRP